MIGGGERYALELAKAMGKKETVRLMSFSDRAYAETKEGIEFIYLKSFVCLNFLKQILWADVIHCHQFFFLSIDFAILLGKLLGKKVFVSDLGGASARSISYHIPLQKLVNSFLLISKYSKSLWQKRPESKQPQRIDVIYGGIDVERFKPGDVSRKTKNIVFVGRQVPHKGIEHLIDAMAKGWDLSVVGRVYNDDYAQFLKKKASGKKVTFEEGLDDDGIIERFQQALVSAQISVYETYDGKKTEVPELFGLSALESMACGTPVIVTDVASLPELVVSGITGFIVPAQNPEAIREKIEALMADPEWAKELGEKARAHVLEHFTWDHVVERCQRIYREA